MKRKQLVIGLILGFAGILISFLQPPIYREVICYNPILHNFGLAVLVVGIMLIIFFLLDEKNKKELASERESS